MERPKIGKGRGQELSEGNTDEVKELLGTAPAQELPAIDLRKPVQKSLLQMLRTRLGETLRDVRNRSYSLYNDTYKIPQRSSPIFEYLDNILSQWDDNAPFPEALCPKLGDRKPAGIYPIASATNTSLRHALNDLYPGLPQYVSIRYNSSDGRCELLWRKHTQMVAESMPAPSGGTATPHRFKRVVVVGKYWRTEFAVDFMRGAHSMARALGIELDDRRGEQQTHEDFGFRDSITSQFHPNNESLLIFFEAPNKVYTVNRFLNNDAGFTVIKSGSSDRFSVGIFNKTLADDLAGRLIEDAEDRRGVVLDLTFPALSSHEHIIRDRSEIYESAINSCSSDRLRYEALPLHGYVYDENIGSQVVQCLAERLERKGSEPIIAILARTELTTIATVDFLRDHREKRPKRPPIACYSESLVFGTLKRLCDPSGPLMAACGVDFYQFGRYAVRIASTPRKWGQTYEQIPPLLITREEAWKAGIFSPDRLPHNFKGVDVHLNDPKFAWEPWMQGPCGESFGPARI